MGGWASSPTIARRRENLGAKHPPATQSRANGGRGRPPSQAPCASSGIVRKVQVRKWSTADDEEERTKPLRDTRRRIGPGGPPQGGTGLCSANPCCAAPGRGAR